MQFFWNSRFFSKSHEIGGGLFGSWVWKKSENLPQKSFYKNLSQKKTHPLFCSKFIKEFLRLQKIFSFEKYFSPNAFLWIWKSTLDFKQKNISVAGKHGGADPSSMQPNLIKGRFSVTIIGKKLPYGVFFFTPQSCETFRSRNFQKRSLWWSTSQTNLVFCHMRNFKNRK